MYHVLCFFQQGQGVSNHIESHACQHLPRLAIFKAAEFAKEFNKLLEDCQWIETTTVSSDAATKDFITRFALLMVLHHAASFHRRILRVVTGYPFRLFMLVKSEKGQDCPERRRETLGP